MQQIDDKGYADKYINDTRSGKKLVKIGMNFSTKQDVRNIDDVYIFKNVKGSKKEFT